MNMCTPVAIAKLRMSRRIRDTGYGDGMAWHGIAVATVGVGYTFPIESREPIM